MLASSPIFSSFGWPFEDPISHEEHNYNNYYRDTETSQSLDLLQVPSIQSQVGVANESTVLLALGGDDTMVKKINHNANERDRRKRINNLISSLRSLLPATDHMKKLSIPATVSRVIKYIPELQKEVEGLVHKKEELLIKLSRQGDNSCSSSEKEEKLSEIRKSLCVVSASQLGDRELVVVQISTVKDMNKSPLSEVLLDLEGDGLLLMNASSFQSFGGGVLHNLQLQVQGTQKIEIEILREKLLSMYEKWELQFP